MGQVATNEAQTPNASTNLTHNGKSAKCDPALFIGSIKLPG